MKIMHKTDLTKSQKLLRRVEREVTILRLMNHPAVTQMIDVIQTTTHLFIILEYMPGGGCWMELLFLLKNRPIQVICTITSGSMALAGSLLIQLSDSFIKFFLVLNTATHVGFATGVLLQRRFTQIFLPTGTLSLKISSWMKPSNISNLRILGWLIS